MNTFNENEHTVGVWWDYSKIIYSAFCSSIHKVIKITDDENLNYEIFDSLKTKEVTFSEFKIILKSVGMWEQKIKKLDWIIRFY